MTTDPTTPEARALGVCGLKVGAVGLGCMGMSQHYGPADEGESIRTIHRAIDQGGTMLDTAISYGAGHNESLIGRAIKGRRGEVTLATKFGIVRSPGGRISVDGRPSYARECCESSLRRLGTDHVDLYYLHRVDQNVPVEESIGAIAELVREGKVRHVGVSETDSENLRRAHATHPISALQAEWSLWSRDIEDAVLPAARGLRIGIVAYRPLGQGCLTGNVTSSRDLTAEDDVRRRQDRFTSENLRRNLALLARMRTLADELEVTPAQLALAWLLAQGHDVVPIPGTKHPRRAAENAAAEHIALTATQTQQLEALIPRGAWSGQRETFAAYDDTTQR
jgi:aryl-alcohol dehydrogenase-like predicted oxidoreductase